MKLSDIFKTNLPEELNPIPIDYLLSILEHSISKMDFINKVIYGCTNEKPNLDAEFLEKQIEYWVFQYRWRYVDDKK